MVTFAPLKLDRPAALNPFEPADYYRSDTEAGGVRSALLVVVAAGSRHAVSLGQPVGGPALTALVAELLSAALPDVLTEVRVGPATSRLDAAPARSVSGRYVAE